MSRYFPRDIELSNDIELTIDQATIGDVGCVVWDAAIVLLKFIDTPYFEKLHNIKSSSFVELGSGTGVVGVATAALGGNVIVTDLEELVALMRRNILKNETKLKGLCGAKTLDWNDELTDISQPDVILVADCIYYEKSILLVGTIRRLCKPSTNVYLSYEEREDKTNLLNQFLQSCEEYFTVEEIPMNLHHPEFRSSDIHILRIKPKINAD